MSLKLLLDEDSQAKPLIKLLQDAGHDVLTVNEIGFNGQPDPIILDYARQSDRLLLTHNCQDFENLHQVNPNHPGILAIYRDNDCTKNLSRSAIVKAIANIEIANVPLVNQFICLNQWNY